jgi:transketolase
VVTVEEHNVRGGLGSAVAEHAAQRRDGALLRMIGVPDEFCRTNGSEADMRRAYGLDPVGLHDTIMGFCRGVAT